MSFQFAKLIVKLSIIVLKTINTQKCFYKKILFFGEKLFPLYPATQTVFLIGNWFLS